MLCGRLEAYVQNICLMSIVAPSRRSSDEQRPHVTCTTCPCSPGVFHETPELRLAHNFMLSEGVWIYSKHYLTHMHILWRLIRIQWALL